ncbi:MAG: hypothetical protein CMO80_15460 [Verrucomicrobiales bacterium]|nr:hypothetical protein [Verrucomicrobiales bacterium]
MQRERPQSLIDDSRTGNLIQNRDGFRNRCNPLIAEIGEEGRIERVGESAIVDSILLTYVHRPTDIHPVHPGVVSQVGGLVRCEWTQQGKRLRIPREDAKQEHKQDCLEDSLHIT